MPGRRLSLPDVQRKAPRRMAVPLGAAFLVALQAFALGCDDDPFKVDWFERADTVRLYSLARPELNLLSAFDFINRYPVRVESPNAAGQWDLAVDTHQESLVFLPAAAVGIPNSRAALAPLRGQTLQEVRRAPSDTTLYVRDRPVPVELGTTYVVRTRQTTGFYGTLCVYYGKLQPLAVDPAAGTVTFVFDVNPNCNDRNLLPRKRK